MFLSFPSCDFKTGSLVVIKMIAVYVTLDTVTNHPPK
jgi:hypothetical protein